MTAGTRLPDGAGTVPGWDLAELLRCLACGGGVRLDAIDESPSQPGLGPDGRASCVRCAARYPIVAGTIRMLEGEARQDLWDRYPAAREVLAWAGIQARITPRGRKRRNVRQRTADSFAYEWESFGARREEWRRNFVDYMRPHAPESFGSRLLLDVGTGSGRHACQASELGARVVAVDLGASIDVARANLDATVLTVQADAERLPLAAGAFDFVMSIGVLHHIPDPDAALAAIVPLARPGGTVHVYLYWVPERRWHQRLLAGVTVARKATVRLPHPVLHALCLPLAAVLAVAIVWPYRIGRRIPGVRRFADALPLQTYADYPFGVLVNDQFDRFSAPLERRYRAGEVAAMLADAGLEDVQVLANFGWVGDGRRPLR